MTTESKKHKRKKKSEVLSRLGRKAVEIPEGVKVTLANAVATVEGKRGKLSFTIPEIITAKVEDKKVILAPKEISKKSKAYHGLSRKLIFNMVEGVTNGFKKTLVIEGVGFRSQISGQKLTLTLGYSHPIVYDVPQGIKVTSETKGANKLIIEGNDKQLVGQVAAEIREIKKPEPYKGTGIRYEDETIHRKAGKAAVGGAGGKK